MSARPKKRPAKTTDQPTDQPTDTVDAAAAAPPELDQTEPDQTEPGSEPTGAEPVGPTRRERRARHGGPSAAVPGPAAGRHYPVPARPRDYAARKRG